MSRSHYGVISDGDQQVVTMEHEPEPQAPNPAPDPEVLPDRRRPGRANYRNLHLIALLRAGHGASSTPDGTGRGPEQAEDTADDLAAARGIAIAVLLGGILWIVVIAIFLMLWTAGVI